MPDLSEMATVSDLRPALIVISEGTPRPVWEAWVAGIREVDGPTSSVPILLIAEPPHGVSDGLTAILPAPLERDATLSILAHWAGPLADHNFRDLADPHYRLVRLGGQAVARRLITQFADRLEEALSWLADPDPQSRLPHQIAGLAGMIGYDDLSRIWRTIDAGDSFDVGSVKGQIDETIAEIRARFPA